MREQTCVLHNFLDGEATCPDCNPSQVELPVMQPNLLMPIHLEDKDVVYTPEWAVKDMIEWFKPNGRILEPCKGDGAFLKHLPNDTHWCEIREGIDFFKHGEKYDWIIGNPPYSMYAKWVYHSMTLAPRFVYLLPCDKPFISYKMYRTMRKWGMVKHIRVYGVGSKLNFPVGFAVGAIYWEKGWQGGLTHSFYEAA